MNALTFDRRALFLALAALACSGGSSSATTCADVAARSVECNPSNTRAYIEQICERFTCSRRQEALDCMVGLPCEGGGISPEACLSDNGCTTATDCGTVADAASHCGNDVIDDPVDGEATYLACTHVACTGDHFFAALDCAASVATTCNATMKADVNTCFTSQGCAALFP